MAEANDRFNQRRQQQADIRRRRQQLADRRQQQAEIRRRRQQLAELRQRRLHRVRHLLRALIADLPAEMNVGRQTPGFQVEKSKTTHFGCRSIPPVSYQPPPFPCLLVFFFPV
jgi:hypothetical protein